MNEGIAAMLPPVLKLFDRELVALFLTLPRIYAFFAASGLFNPAAVPRVTRTGLILVLAFIAVPMNYAAVDDFDRSVPTYVGLFAKEFVIGALLGHMVGWVFWSMQAVGSLIDNQRGAAIAAAADPLMGQEASPIGIMLSQAFVTYILATGAIFPLLGLLYQSYAVWPVMDMLPGSAPELPMAAVKILDGAMHFVMLIGGPVVIVMFLAEFALAMVSRFSPQIQVFVLAMPIKSVLGLFMLILYVHIMFPYAEKTLLGTIGLADRLAVILGGESAKPDAFKLMYPVPETPPAAREERP